MNIPRSKIHQPKIFAIGNKREKLDVYTKQACYKWIYLVLKPSAKTSAPHMKRLRSFIHESKPRVLIFIFPLRDCGSNSFTHLNFTIIRLRECGNAGAQVVQPFNILFFRCGSAGLRRDCGGNSFTRLTFMAIVRHKCFPVCPRAQHLLRHKFCVRDTKIVSDFVQKHFVSATNVS